MPGLPAMRFDERNGTSVLERGFRLLRAFAPRGGQLPLAELAKRAELPKTTAFRLANQLVALGALERHGDSYGLGMQLFEMGSIVPRQRRLRDAALPFMQDLYEATHETIHLGVVDGDEVLYIDKIAGRRGSRVDTQVGTRKPLYCTALGKAILARSSPAFVAKTIDRKLTRHTPYTVTSPAALRKQFDRIVAEGVAFDREEYSLGISCVASALVDRAGMAIGAISITGPTSRFRPESYAAAARAAALGISRALGDLPIG